MATREQANNWNLPALLVFLVICAAAAGIGNLLTALGQDGWYSSLEQPSWNPPDAVFGPVWGVLYVFIAISAWLVWKEAGWERAKVPLLVWGVQLALNVGWTGVFFGLNMIGAALVEIVVLALAIAATIALFWPINRLAALLLVPYLGWVLYATALNYSIWTLN